MDLATRPYEWMVSFTPQRQWIEGRGRWLWLAFFFGGLGGGLYLVSLYYENITGMLLGWLIVIVLKGAAHLAFLGRPARFWRAFLRPRTSWISRGLIFISAFGILGALQVAPSVLPSLPWSTSSPVLTFLSGSAAFLVCLYTGFVLNSLNSVSFWNTSVLPLLFVLYGLLGGLGISLLQFSLQRNEADLASAEGTVRILLLAAALLLAIYLLSAYQTTPASRQSVLRLVGKGRLALVFYGAVVLLGLIVPALVSLWALFVGGVTTPALVLAVGCELVGSLALRYCLLMGGIYMPLV